MPRQSMPYCVVLAVAVAGSMHGVGTEAVDLGTINDPLADTPVFLPVDRAFAFSSTIHVGEGGVEEIVARWDIPEGYYLYRHGFTVEAGAGLTLGEPTLPPGELRTDEYFGESEVYLGGVDVVVPVLNRTAAAATVRFGYQGCAERGLCYPPAERKVTFRFGHSPPAAAGWPYGASHGGIPAVGLVLLLVAAWAVRRMRSRSAIARSSRLKQSGPCDNRRIQSRWQRWPWQKSWSCMGRT